MDRGFLGGQHKQFPPVSLSDWPVHWQGRHPSQSLWFQSRGLGERIFSWDTLCLVIQGYLRLSGSSEAPTLERLAEEMRWRYLEEGTLDLGGLEGNGSLVLLDAQAGQVLLYRTPSATNPIYYRVESGGLLFASNLVALVEAAGVPPRPDLAAAGAYLGRGDLPERGTFFEGCARLLPGELLCWTEQGCQRQLRPATSGAPCRSARGSYRERLTAVVADCLAVRPCKTNLLTGSLASCGVQVILNDLVGHEELLPPTFSLAPDQPAAWKETEQAVQASLVLGTGHRLVQPEGPVTSHLLDFLAATGELPGDGPDLYLGQLAHALQAEGISSALSESPTSCWPGEDVPDQRLLQHAARTTSLFQAYGVDLLYPLFDSRLFPGREQASPVGWWPWRRRTGLRQELSRLVPAELRRPPGRPVSLPAQEWLTPGGELWSEVERLRQLDYLSPASLPAAVLCRPEVLYRAVCYGLWHEMYIDGTLPRKDQQPAEASALSTC